MTLVPSTEPETQGITWTWKKDGGEAYTADSDPYKFELTDETKGRYVAIATKDDGATDESDPVSLEVRAAADEGVVDLVLVEPDVSSTAASAGSRDLVASVPVGPVKLSASANPAAAADAKWDWKRDGEVVKPDHTSEYAFDFTAELIGEYMAVAKPSGRESNKLMLKVASDPKKNDAAVELEVGEYDWKFAAAAGIAILTVTVVGIALLTQSVSLRLPGLSGNAPATGTYEERVRGFVVIVVVCIGMFALAIGMWLAALEVRGRLRKERKVEVPAVAVADGGRGALEDAAKFLDAASKLRGTVAVLVAATALLLGALWAVTRDPGAAMSSFTSQLGD